MGKWVLVFSGGMGFCGRGDGGGDSNVVYCSRFFGGGGIGVDIWSDFRW